MFNPDIFRSYDIRGIVPDEFDPSQAYHIGRAYAQYTNARTVVVARDMRPSGVEIMKLLVEGLTHGGVDVIDIGQATTPLFYFAVHHLRSDGGMIVTASHNPGRYNGIKMTRKEAIPIGGSSGLMDIRDLVGKAEWEDGREEGSVSEADVRSEYLDVVTKDVDASGLTIAIDAGNGMAGLLLKEYCDRINAHVIPLYWELDGTFPNHEADPLKEENMRDLQRAVKEHGADLGAAFDGDGDRVFFTTEKGDIVPGDIASACIAQKILADNPGSTVLYDLRSSRSTKEAIEESGGIPKVSKVGHANIKMQMREEGAVFAGELSGHFYFSPWYAESALLALGYVIRMMQEEKKSVSELVAPLIRYAKTSEINFTVDDKEGALHAIKETYGDADIFELDGITISYPSWWANVRASNTEPLLRLNMEADTPELLEEKRREIETLLVG